MAEGSGERSVMPHPPGGVPKYFDSSPFDGAQIAKAGAKSRRLELYDALSKAHFAQIPDEVTDGELAWLETFHRERLEAEREERRMHFGAFALVGVLFFLLFPALIAQAFQMLALDLLALLLLVLIVPYVFVYFGYENRVRAMALGLFRIMEARALRAELAAKKDAPVPP
jgi:hypothetical protein